MPVAAEARPGGESQYPDQVLLEFVKSSASRCTSGRPWVRIPPPRPEQRKFPSLLYTNIGGCIRKFRQVRPDVRREDSGFALSSEYTIKLIFILR